jgi:4-carboxymuconolactone decarboxylase
MAIGAAGNDRRVLTLHPEVMSADHGAAGGRLPLYDREGLDGAQKELFDQLMNLVVPWAEDAGFQARTKTGRLIGPFNPALLTPQISSAFFELQLVEQKHTSLSECCREVVILTVGAVWQATYELYAHCAVGRHAGLCDETVRTLADGGLPKDLSDAETVAHRVARALSVHHRLDEALYREAVSIVGPDGLMEIVMLTGIYHTVCAILNGFAIPAPC